MSNHCRICGNEIHSEDERRRTCGKQSCKDAWSGRDEARKRSRLAQARSIAKNPVLYGQSQRRFAAREIAFADSGLEVFDQETREWAAFVIVDAWEENKIGGPRDHWLYLTSWAGRIIGWQRVAEARTIRLERGFS